MTQQNAHLTRELFDTFTQFRRVMEKASTMSFEEKHATMLQCQALKFLEEHPNSTTGELAATLRMSSSAVAQFTDRLVLARSVHRVHDKNDRRIVRLSISVDGKKQLATIQKSMMEKMSTMISLIPADDVKHLVRIHTALLKRLEEKYN